MNTLQTIEIIPVFDGEIYVEWTRSLNDIILQIAWPFLSKIIHGRERPEPILSGSREEGNTSDLDDNDSNPGDVSGHGSGSLNK